MLAVAALTEIIQDQVVTSAAAQVVIVVIPLIRVMEAFVSFTLSTEQRERSQVQIQETYK
jgi:hypothetical protein